MQRWMLFCTFFLLLSACSSKNIVTDESIEDRQNDMSFDLQSEPAEAYSTNSAIQQLLITARAQQERGELTLSAATLERAIRIAPKDAASYYYLAGVRLEQSLPQQTEQLARKGLALANDDQDLQSLLWLMIADSKKMRGDYDGAEKAEMKAGSL